MGKKTLLLLMFWLALLYPLFLLFQLDKVTLPGTELALAEQRLLNYQISIWICWVLFACLGIYYKWTTGRNLFFGLTYGFLFLAFSIFGIYVQLVVNYFNIPSPFKDEYTLGIFTAIQNILIAAVLTGFLQAGVWWFTRRWHRK